MFGYMHRGLRQPACALTLRLRLSQDVDFAHLDGLMYRLFELDASHANDAPPTDDTQAGKLAWRVLLLGRYLRQAARVPAFDLGVLQGVSETAGDHPEFHVTFLVPALDGLSLADNRRAYHAAAWTVSRLLASPGIPDPQTLFASLDKDVVRPMRALSQSGVSTLPILRAAHAAEIPFRHLGGGYYLLGQGRRSTKIRASAVQADSGLGFRISQDKFQTAELLRSAGLPTPVHQLVRSEEQALQVARDLGWPLVVKPADRDRSEGVSVHISDDAALLAAYRKAIAISRNVLVEREVPGICYRLLVANGVFQYAISRKPVAIAGDGNMNISQLIEKRLAKDLQRPHWRRNKPISLDAATVEALRAQGLHESSVPGMGQKVALRLIESSEWGGDVEDVSELVHSTNVSLAERAARLLGLSTAGIDMICTDISRPWNEGGMVINEVNYSPYFGGNPIAQARLPGFLEGLIEGDGRVDAELFVGGPQALEKARRRQQASMEKGQRAYLTSHDLTLGPEGLEMPIAAQGLFDRCIALQLDPCVERMLIVVQTTQWLLTGMPVDRVHAIEVCEGAVLDDTPAGAADEATQEKLLTMLRTFLGPDATVLKPS